MAALFLAEEGFHVLLCGAEFTQFDLRFLVTGVETVFLRGKGLIFGIQLFEVRQSPEPIDRITLKQPMIIVIFLGKIISSAIVLYVFLKRIKRFIE